MTPSLLDGVCRVLRATARGNPSPKRLSSIELRIRRAFGQRLRNGAGIMPIGRWASRTDAIHTVMTVKRKGEACIATNVAVTVFTGGALSSSPADAAGNIKFLYTGNGKAFKFIRHDPGQSMFQAGDFHANCFPYKVHELECIQGECGTLAMVKSAARASFTTSGQCLVSPGRIEDLRLYTDRAKLVYDLVTLYEEIIAPDDRRMRDRIFHALF